jgi:heme o synthase
MSGSRNKTINPADLIALTKAGITLAVTLSTLTAWIMFAGKVDFTAFRVVLGVFLLASSSSALNQVQERRTDALMGRTRGRPLPAGRMDVRTAILVVVLLFVAGSLLLAVNTLSLGLGFLSYAWYNALYTPLKYRSVFALALGSVIGALPPLIGWTAAGGAMDARPVLSLSLFIYLWQVPHFVLLLLRYSGEYKAARLPVLSSVYSFSFVRRILLLWLAGTTVAGIMLPQMAGVQHSGLGWALAGGVAVLNLLVVFLLFRNQKQDVRNAFIILNACLLWVLALLSAGKLLSV